MHVLCFAYADFHPCLGLWKLEAIVVYLIRGGWCWWRRTYKEQQRFNENRTSTPALLTNFKLCSPPCVVKKGNLRDIVLAVQYRKGFSITLRFLGAIDTLEDRFGSRPCPSYRAGPGDKLLRYLREFRGILTSFQTIPILFETTTIFNFGQSSMNVASGMTHVAWVMQHDLCDMQHESYYVKWQRYCDIVQSQSINLFVV